MHNTVMKMEWKRNKEREHSFYEWANAFENYETFGIRAMSCPKTHSKDVLVISHLKPEGSKYKLTKTFIL